ncbi:CXA4 protein, partial [Atractosteus spatula]|nr:CXA4 protein [Atractosteus spatula]
MSRADWSFLEHFLEEGQQHSTAVGKVWLTVLFLFRVLVLGTAAESAWDDEQSDFVCNTKQPGCESVCYDKSFPISHFRYFVLQIIFVSAPTIFYFGYVALRSRRDKKRGRQGEEGGGAERVEEEKIGGKERLVQESPSLRGTLLWAYAISTLVKLVTEVGFSLGLWYLYGFTISARYVCERSPCPHKVDCFVSRPTEKTIFTIYMQVVSAVSVLLNVLELLHLLRKGIVLRLEEMYRLKDERLVEIAMTPRLGSPQGSSPLHPEKGYMYLPLDNEVPSSMRLPQPCQSNNLLSIGSVDWEGQADPKSTEPVPHELPSYNNCVVTMKPSIPRPSKSSGKKPGSRSSKSSKGKKGQYV